MIKRFYILLLAIVASVGMGWAAVDDSGSCGDNVTYSFNGTTGALVITGTGPMTVFSSGTAPWKNYKADITSVVVEDGVTSVSQYSFGQCTNLTTVVIGNDVETIGQFAFNDCGTSFTSLTLGSSLKSVGMAAFLNAKGITTLTLPDGFETVGDYAFCRLEALQTLNIPSSVTSIGTYAFYRCYPLATINCAAVTPPSLGDDAFGDIANKSNIPLYVPNGSVAAYTAAAQWNAFNIQGYDPAPAPANVCGDGLTWELNGGVLTISYDGVGTGEMYDFGYEYDANPVNVAPWKENKSEITTVIVGDGVKSIGNYAFNDLYENFTAVTIANSVERIGLNAFMNAKWITEITLPSSLKTIDKECFAANFGFTSITIPSGVTSIGNKAFCYCTGLTSLTCEATTPPTLGSSVFYKITSKTSDMSNIPLYVPSESVAAYEAAAQWNAFDVQAITGGGSTDVIPCTAADLGKVLCTDGSIYATVSEATAASKTAAAVIAYVDTENGKALALALADDGEMEWETAKTTAPAHTPAVSGGTWTLPSKDDWNNMITAAGGYEALRDCFSGVGGTNMQKDSYWSSTPVDAYAWMYYFDYGGRWIDGYVDDPSYVRACLTFNIPAAPAYETVMNLINAIGTVELTAECKAKIDAARTAYDALSTDDKALVTNIATLTQAETDYAALAAAAAAPVIAQIEALPTAIKLSTYFSTYDLMVAARAAYNTLSAEVQAAVTNLSKLTNLEDAFAAIGGVNEKLSKPFSVGEGQVVYFAHGNLQATYNGTNWSWAFAAHQYDYIGDASGNIIINGNGTLSGAGTVDLFGWVANSSTVLTSGVAKYGVSNSDNVGDYGLGETETLKGDWGVAANDANIGGYNDWRILSKDEWVYLFKTRTDAASKYGYATVDNKNGVIILPDAFTDPMKNKGNKAFIPQNVDKGYSTNVYTTGGDWEAMEAAGAVFMPAAGRRYGTTMTVNEGTGFYWSSTPMSYQASYFMGFMGSNVVPDNDRYRSHGLSVRLVSNNAPVVSTPLEYALAAVALINAIPTPVTLDDACKDAIDAARAAVDALGANASLIDDADMNKLTQAETDYADLKTAADQAEADKVIAKINNIPQPVTLKLATRDSIESARAAYDALTADQKLLVSNYDVLTAAEATLAGLNPGGGAPLPEGALTGAFSINAGGDKIAFSKGNLQATTANLGETWTWAFAAHQYDYVGNAVANTAITGSGTVSANGTVDLFGWSTAATYYGINNSNVSGKHPGDFIDWGETIAEGWRTLTRDEWNYLFETRTDAASKYGQATVAGIHGIIVLPDSYKGTAINADRSDWSNNIISAEDWAAYEANGVAFLPAAGSRLTTNVNYVGEYGMYWTSTTYYEKFAYRVRFLPNLSPDYGDRVPGHSVRLVTAHTGTPTPLDSAQAVKDLIEAIPAEITTDDACVKAIEDARAAYNALTEATKGALDAATVNKLTDAEAAYAILVKAEADAVVAKINNIPTPVELKLATRDSIESARAAYDALNAYQKPMVTNYDVLTTAEATMAGLNPGVPPATPLDSAQAVKDLIDAIPTPVEYPTSGQAIAAALVAYQQLSDAAKGALDDADVQKMTDAAIQYAALDAIAAIEAIPAEIVYDPAAKAAIEAAREKYDALIDASKALVDAEVVAKLTNAEKAWADLVALIEHNVSYIGKDGELKNEKVALLHIPDPAPDFNGYEFVRLDVKAGDFLEEGLRIKAVYTPIITTDPVAYDTLVYNGTAQELVAAGVAKEGHIEYRLNEGDWSAELPEATNAAAYVVYYKLVREGHEDYMAGSVTAVIAKAPVTYVAPQAYDTLAYNYNAQVLVTAGQTNDGTIEYSLDPNMLDSWSADLPQAMNAGTYDVYFRVQGDLNHFDSIAPAPVAVTIAKRDIVITAPVAYDTLVYNSQSQTLAAAGSADFGSMEYTMTPDNNEGWSADMPQAVDAGTYAVYYRVQGDANHNDFAASIAATVAKAQLTVIAEDKEVEYGESAPEFTVTFNGWQGQDDASVVSDLTISSDYAVGSSVGTYAIVPSGATALNYTMSYVNGSLTVNKAKVSVINAEAQKAKFADGHAVAVVLNQGTLDGVKLNDAVTHVTTATFSSAEVAENLTITLFYELQGDEALLANYLLEPTSKIFSEEGVIIEPFLPDNEGKPEDEEAKIQEGIEVYAYGYCTGTGYSLNYHLNSGNPDQYKIEFEDSRFDDVAYEETEIKGRDGVIDIEIPDGLPTGDYKMTVTFRDSRFDWLESAPFEVTFHVNMPETYVKPLFNNTIVLVDTLDQFTDIQWYYRADATKTWQPVAGATGHYLHVDGKLEGEYFVAAKYDGKPTFTCGQADMETLYGADSNKQAKVRAYPNPVVTTTTVSIENSDNYEHSLRIVNLMGIEVKNTTFEGNETVVDMDSYTTGNYTISVDGIVVKVLKQ